MPPMAVARTMSQLAHDVVELAELQSALVRLELEGVRQKIAAPVVLLGVTAIVGITCIPLMMVSGALGLTELTGWPLWASLLAVAAVGLVVAVICGLVGWGKVKALSSPLPESRREWSRNMRWIKSVLRHKASPTSALHPIRHPD